METKVWDKEQHHGLAW